MPCVHGVDMYNVEPMRLLCFNKILPIEEGEASARGEPPARAPLTVDVGAVLLLEGGLEDEGGSDGDAPPQGDLGRTADPLTGIETERRSARRRFAKVARTDRGGPAPPCSLSLQAGAQDAYRARKAPQCERSGAEQQPPPPSPPSEPIAMAHPRGDYGRTIHPPPPPPPLSHRGRHRPAGDALNGNPRTYPHQPHPHPHTAGGIVIHGGGGVMRIHARTHARAGTDRPVASWWTAKEELMPAPLTLLPCEHTHDHISRCMRARARVCERFCRHR